MNHLPCRYVVQDHCRRVSIRDAIGDGKEVFRLTDKKLRKAAIHSERGHALAQLKTCDASANRIHHARDLISGHKRDLRREHVVSRQHAQIGCAHAGSADPNANLPRPGWLNRQLDDLEDLGSALLGQHHCAICRRHGCCQYAMNRPTDEN